MPTYQKNTKEVPLRPTVFDVLRDGQHNIIIKNVDFIEKTKSTYLMELICETEEGNQYNGNVFVDYNPNSVFSQIARLAVEEGTEVLAIDDLIDLELTIILQTKGSWQNIVGVMPIQEEEEQPKKKTKKKKKKQRFEYDGEDEEDDY